MANFRFKLLFILLPLFLLTSCSLFGVRSEKREVDKNRKPPLITMKPYNYETNERVFFRIRGLEDCKVNLDGSNLMVSTKFKFPQKYVKDKKKAD